MGSNKIQRDNEDIRPVSEAELPPEFKSFDKPFGVEQHVYNIVFPGIITHACMAYYFLYLLPFGLLPSPIKVNLFAILYGYLTGLGTTIGAHRYWTHKAFKANKPLQYLLMLLQTAGGQNPIFKWVRDHRIHHKYTDTNADPYNAARGFWFSHMTWMMTPKHPDLVEKLKCIDVSDLVRDPVVRFQSKYYWEIFFVVFYVIPMGIMRFLIPEMSFLEMFVANHIRFGLSLHFTWLVNSVAHIWGTRPYDKYITSTENHLVALLAIGEGWHNYYHAFPWDHRTSDLGFKIDVSALIIRFFAMIGWAWDLKTVSHELLVDRINRTGDGSHPLHRKNSQGTPPSWGWGDKDMKKEDMAVTEILFPSKRRTS